MKQKGFSPLIIILVIAILSLVGYFGYKYFKTISQSPPITPPTPAASSTPKAVTDPTEDWKTYINSKYNYEFRYPQESTLNNQSDEHVAASYMGQKQKNSGNMPTELFDGYAFNVTAVTDGNYTDLDDYFAKTVDQLKEICTKIGIAKETLIDGKRAITHELTCLGDYDTYYTQNGDTYYEISLLHVGDSEDRNYSGPRSISPKLFTNIFRPNGLKEWERKR